MAATASSMWPSGGSAAGVGGALHRVTASKAESKATMASIGPRSNARKTACLRKRRRSRVPSSKNRGDNLSRPEEGPAPRVLLSSEDTEGTPSARCTKVTEEATAFGTRLLVLRCSRVTARGSVSASSSSSSSRSGNSTALRAAEAEGLTLGPSEGARLPASCTQPFGMLAARASCGSRNTAPNQRVAKPMRVHMKSSANSSAAPLLRAPSLNAFQLQPYSLPSHAPS
mmetsp:Transcript_58387/g.125467  ORF Transcript_58387/g.125467 Transcript_58387/m.125467 type:complete len:228 (+) Transcript_58387:248-931(+)